MAQVAEQFVQQTRSIEKPSLALEPTNLEGRPLGSLVKDLE